MERFAQVGYFGRLRLFSRNARLYLLHVIGMDLIHGAWEVLFNLYLLAVGFDVRFVGIRIAVLGIAGALASIPAGRLADRIDRKWGFIIGDGGGAACALVLIMSETAEMILAFSAVSACFSALHHVTESPFMAENSEPEERIHLFSVEQGLATLAAMAGALIAGFLPEHLMSTEGMTLVDAYRWAVHIGIAWWFLSLIPAVMLRRHVSEEVTRARAEVAQEERGGWMSAIRTPKTVYRFVVIGALLSLGGGFVLRLANVFFHYDLHAHEHEIGMVFAAGSFFLAIGAFAVPLVVERLGEVATIVWTRFAAVPFILLIGYAPELASPETVVSLAGLAWVLRTTLFNMSGPAFEAFSMGQLHPTERATYIGVSHLFGSAMAAVGGYLGAVLMGNGDFRTPFVVMAVLYAVSTALFMRWFEGTPGLSDPSSLQESVL
ncbi:MAG: MFS transporter [Candidatus Thermoplasmatota archaeon]|nr:MFS transporter [Candidatus Thermoplasmatota archaeon]